MTVLCIAKARGINKEALALYREHSGAALAKHGAKALQSSPAARVIEGQEAPYDVVAVLEFPNAQAVTDWYQDEELAPVHELRAKSGDWTILMLGS